MQRFLLLLLICHLLTGCRERPVKEATVAEEQQIPLKYARGFAMYKGEGYYRVLIRDADDTLSISETYYFIFDTLQYESSRDRLEIVLPLQRIASTSTTHIGFLAALQHQQSLVGITGSRWVQDATIVAALDNGTVQDIGEEGTLDNERLIALHPQVLLAYNSGLDADGQAAQIRRLGIPVVMVNEYLEDHPLGMAEWGKLFALLLDVPEAGEAWFRNVESTYLSIQQTAREAGNRPRVLTGLPYRGEWTVSGGKSFAATYLLDAGAAYLWEDNDSPGNFPVSLEEVMLRAEEATIWVNPGAAGSIKRIGEADKRLLGLPPVQNNAVYNNNKRVNKYGGNDYWESAVARPDRVLLDLALIFHPEFFPNDTLYYYTQLK
jgi:iron complex transport system substrate-binding protein